MSFDDIIGQNEVKSFLKKSLIKKRIASAYLFSGPEGVGKTITALNLARALNCKIHETDSCDMYSEEPKCPSCKKIDAFSHPDVLVIIPAPRKIRKANTRRDILVEGEFHKYHKTDVISVDDIRYVEDMVYLKPFEAKKRVIIVIDAERMKVQAQNAFLKVLEEPPEDTTIILTSSHPEGLFSTIRSRCQRIGFSRLSRGEMAEYIEKNAYIKSEEADLLYLLSGGSIKKLRYIVDKDRESRRAIFRQIVKEKDYDRLTEIYDKEQLEEFIEFLLPLFRDIYVCGKDTKLINLDIREYIKSVRGSYSDSELEETIDILSSSLINIRRYIDPVLISNVIFNRIKEG
jgi:DNA polymerase-3 subunit delta'